MKSDYSSPNQKQNFQELHAYRGLDKFQNLQCSENRVEGFTNVLSTAYLEYERSIYSAMWSASRLIECVSYLSIFRKLEVALEWEWKAEKGANNRSLKDFMAVHDSYYFIFGVYNKQWYLTISSKPVQSHSAVVCPPSPGEAVHGVIKSAKPLLLKPDIEEYDVPQLVY